MITRYFIGLRRQIILLLLRLLQALRWRSFALACVLVGATCKANAQTIAAASDVQSVLDPLVAQYNQSNNANVRVTYGSSGKLAAQIAAGAPFAIFVSGDSKWVTHVQKRYPLAENRVIAPGRLALVANTGNVVCEKGLNGLALAPGKVAIANAQHAPYGEAAKAVLLQQQLWHSLTASGRIVQAESAALATQWLASGNASIGLVGWLSALTLDAKQFCVQEIPTAQIWPLFISVTQIDPAASAVFRWMSSDQFRLSFVNAGQKKRD